MPYANNTKKHDISIHALRGEGDNPKLSNAFEKYVISIHALRGEGDDVIAETLVSLGLFQSTPSVGRATKSGIMIYNIIKDFNPRPPWGGRR